MPIEIGVVFVVIIVVIPSPISGIVAVVIAMPIAAIPPWMMTTPAPAPRETAVVPAIAIVPRTIIVRGPPPVVTHVNTYPPILRIAIVPIHIGIIGVVKSPSGVNVRMKTSDSGSIKIIVIVIIIVNNNYSGFAGFIIIKIFFGELIINVNNLFLCLCFYFLCSW
jgi:hypothetical protein